MHPGGATPFLLRSCFVQCTATVPEHQRFPRCPAQLRAFWDLYEWAHLFKDEQFGQWGIELLSAKDSSERTVELADSRPSDSRDGDVVFGRFLGDSELLVMDACGTVLVCLPLDDREAWPVAASSLVEFLSRLYEAQGAKYWER